MKTVQSERRVPALEHLAAEHRATDQARRNARRLAAWRVKWWVRFDVWPDESVRLAQTLTGWPAGHRRGWPKVPPLRTVADVISLVDRRHA